MHLKLACVWLAMGNVIREKYGNNYLEGKVSGVFSSFAIYLPFRYFALRIKVVINLDNNN